MVAYVGSLTNDVSSPQSGYEKKAYEASYEDSRCLVVESGDESRCDGHSGYRREDWSGTWVDNVKGVPWHVILVGSLVRGSRSGRLYEVFLGGCVWV